MQCTDGLAYNWGWRAGTTTLRRGWLHSGIFEFGYWIRLNVFYYKDVGQEIDIFWMIIKLNQYFWYVRWWFYKFWKSLLLWYFMVNLLFASAKLLTNFKNPSTNPLQRLWNGDFGPWKHFQEPACGPEIYRKPPSTCTLSISEQIFWISIFFCTRRSK